MMPVVHVLWPFVNRLVWSGVPVCGRLMPGGACFWCTGGAIMITGGNSWCQMMPCSGG